MRSLAYNIPIFLGNAAVLILAIGRICTAVNRLQVADADPQPQGVPVQLAGVGSITGRAPASPGPSP